MVNTQPNRGRDVPPEYLVDIKDRPYIINFIQDELFEVIFLSKEDFYENIDTIKQRAKETISDCLFKEKFWSIIFQELLENIQKHSDGLSSQKFSLKKEKNQYTIEISNFCEEKDFQKLVSFLEINAMSPDDLKKAHKKQRLEGTLSERNGAGLGFLTIARMIKKHSKTDFFNFIDIKNLGNMETTKTTDKGEESVKLIDTRIIINIPFPNGEDITNNLNDYHNNEQSYLGENI